MLWVQVYIDNFSFFPVCSEVPPSGFFEYRTQNWTLGANINGIVVIDNDSNRYVSKFQWETINFAAIKMAFIVFECARGKTKEMMLITPQSFIIHNLCLRLKYKWAKENMKWKPKVLPASSNSALELNEKKDQRRASYLALKVDMIDTENKNKANRVSMMMIKKNKPSEAASIDSSVKAVDRRVF